MPNCALAAGELPLAVVRLFSHLSWSVIITDDGPGFTLPVNIGDLGPAITHLNIGHCYLRGATSIIIEVPLFVSW